MASLTRRLILLSRPLTITRSLSCCRPSQSWWVPQPVQSLTDVPVRMKAKVKKSQVSKIDEAMLAGHVDVEVFKKSLQTAVDALDWQFTRTLTVRPSLALLDYIKVPINGKTKRIRDIARVTQQKDHFLIVCTGSNYPEVLQAINDAVLKANLELFPVKQSESSILIKLPRPTNAYRQNLAKLAKEAVDKAKFGIRRVRNNIVSDVKKLQSVSRDDTKRYEEQVDLISRLYIDRVDDMLKTKLVELSAE